LGIQIQSPKVTLITKVHLISIAWMNWWVLFEAIKIVSPSRSYTIPIKYLYHLRQSLGQEIHKYLGIAFKLIVNLFLQANCYTGNANDLVRL